jgi:small subunit ribosomal protein S2
MLTNFTTVHQRVGKMREMARMEETGEVDLMIKKEGLKLRRDLTKLQRNLGGIRNMEKLPAVVFVIDTKKEHIAVTEANRLGIPVVAVVDTNCDPDIITFAIPGNDDAMRSADLMCRVIADAVEEGRYLASRKGARPGTKAEAPVAPVLTAEEKAERAEVQATARNEAAAAQAERERRLEESKAQAAETPVEAPVEQPVEEIDPAVETVTGSGTEAG